MPTKPRFKRCTARRFCFALDARIEDTANARRKGFVLMVLTNFATGKTRKIGVCYKPIDAGFKDKTE